MKVVAKVFNIFPGASTQENAAEDAAGDQEVEDTIAKEESESEVTSNPIREDETSQRFSFIRVDQSRAVADPVSALYSLSALEINKLTMDMKWVTRRMFLNTDERTLEM